MTAEFESILRPGWPAPSRVRAACTTRIGGHSQGPWASFNLGERVGDAPAAVAANRAQLARELALPGAPQWLHQVHGTDLVAAADDGLERRGDASWTRRPGVVCAVQSADCLPILLCDRDGTCVAALHGGWRGLAAGIIPRTLAALALPPGRWLAWLGPAICGSCYEVGEEVRAAFSADTAVVRRGFRPAARKGHWCADLAAIARAQLTASGVPETAIFGGDLCTRENSGRFYSYRRDGTTGRMAALIWLV
ncbi:MAG: peptidoglycan editing factor PgeF [Porticoccaceae bacterium]